MRNNYLTPRVGGGNYCSPTVERATIALEKGFAASGSGIDNAGSYDYGTF